MGRRRRFLACAVVIGILAGRATAGTPVLQFGDAATRLAVWHAVEGAADRLAHPRCQGLLSDFTDEFGQSLATRLAASRKTPAEAFDLLRFVEDGGAPQCRAEMRLAFTRTGSPLIRVCGQQFKDQVRRNRTTAEIIVIHEFLHALGLGENPPTSQAITERVAFRCRG